MHTEDSPDVHLVPHLNMYVRPKDARVRVHIEDCLEVHLVPRLHMSVRFKNLHVHVYVEGVGGRQCYHSKCYVGCIGCIGHQYCLVYSLYCLVWLLLSNIHFQFLFIHI